MIHKTIKKIHTFRVFFLCFIIAAFLFNLGLNPIDIGLFLGSKVGATVGLEVSIPENPFNKIAAQLKTKEDKLALKEKELNDREMALKEMGEDPDILIYLMGGGIVFLFFLILLNYYLDFSRRKRKIT